MTATHLSRRFLVVQLGDIGDLVLSTPALSALREAHPNAHIAVLTTSHAAAILEGTGLADEIILAKRTLFDRRDPLGLLRLLAALRRGKYDTTLFFHHLSTQAGAQRFALIARAAGSLRRVGLDNGRGFFLTDKIHDGGFGVKHQADYWLEVVAAVGADGSPRPPLIGTSSRIADTLPPRPDNRMRIAIHAGSGAFNPSRRWEAEKFAAVADGLVDRFHAQVVFVGGADDDTAQVKAHMRTAPLDVSGQTSLTELAGVLKTCQIFIGVDSGVMHIAAAVGARVVALFGPTNPNVWHPYHPHESQTVLTTNPECSPCGYVSHEVGALHGCAARTCMRMIPVFYVLNSIPPLGRADTNLERGLPSLPTPPDVRRISILDFPVSAITYDDWIRLIDGWITSTPSPPVRLHHVCTINPEMIIIARRDPIFRYVLRRASLTVPDGVGLLWAAKRLGTPLQERVTGSDGVPRIAAAAAERGWRIFLLGAGAGIAEKAAQVLTKRHPALKIVGVYAGSPAPEEEDAIVERVNAAEADILFVAYGAPEQDKWIARNSPRLHVTMAMGIGGTLDFIAGEIPRAPVWMQRMGLEWLYRLYLQPWRIKRMMRLPHFVLAVLVEKDIQRKGAKDSETRR
jgi:exopolysaccharide biosynthesis WecB/TagA/CpsF family protein